jgi:hypothetical protein
MSILDKLDKLLLKPVPNVEVIYRHSRVEQELPAVLKILALWDNNTTNLWRWHIILGTMATIFSILAAIGFSSTGIIPSDNLNDTNNLQTMFNAAQQEIKQMHAQKVTNQIFGFLAAVSISLLTAFNLGAKSNNTRNAWRELNTTVMRFNQNIVQKSDVINAYERGETMIGGITFTKEGIEFRTDQQGTDQQGTDQQGTDQQKRASNKKVTSV